MIQKVNFDKERYEFCVECGKKVYFQRRHMPENLKIDKLLTRLRRMTDEEYGEKNE